MDHKVYPLETIASTRNQKVKNTILLQKPRERKKQKLFLVEGRKEVTRAIQAGYTFERIFICRELYEGGRQSRTFEGDLETPNSASRSKHQNAARDLKHQGSESDLKHHGSEPDLKHQGSELDLKQIPDTCEIDYVSPKVYTHMAYRGTTEGIIGWALPKNHDLNEIKLSDNPLILIVDAVEKPGNLGAILRTADAAGIDALIISDTRTDVYNPNVIRSSLGAVFSTQVGVSESESVIDWLKKKIYCTALTVSKPYTDIDYSFPSAIVMGTEATGLSDSWLKQSDQNIIIPMKGIVDSMNVSVSTGIVLFEAVRQRNIDQ
jgi:TrmH family RNA methyltransferase